MKNDVARWERELCEEDRTLSRLRKRGKRLTHWIQERPEPSICLVSHAAIIGVATKDTYMENCEVRIYRLARGRWKRLETHAAPTLTETLTMAMRDIHGAMTCDQPSPSATPTPTPDGDALAGRDAPTSMPIL